MVQRSANVFFKDKFAGTLFETADGGTCFTYEQTWTEEIACCFPTVRREYDYPNGLHPFFQHLGPEGWLREQQARIAHIVEEDDLGLLLRYGTDCIGAMSVRPKEETEPSFEVTEAFVNPGRTVSGVQKKLLISKDNRGGFRPAPAVGPAPYIAKFNSPSIPTLVRNEALSLRWLSTVLGKEEVNQFTIAHIQALNETALVVTRFDRGPIGEKLRLEDCAQILCKPRGRDYAGKYDAAYEEVAAIIAQYSARPAIDLARLFRRLIAFALIGNCDAHLKNFSLLETPTGLRLSPAYDVVNTAIYPEYDQKLALSICSQKVPLSEASEELFREFGKKIGLPGKAIEQIFTDLKRQVKKATLIITPPPAEDPDGFVHRFEEIVKSSCLRILK